MKNIGLGLMRLAKLNVEEAEKLILCALENDIQLFDHADIYGSRKCEQIFGEVLKRNPKLREKMIIQSKCAICRGYYDLSKEHIINQVEESIRLLNCDYLDILLLHRPDALVDYNEVNEAFEYLYNKGLVKNFGVSNMNPIQIELYNKYLTHKMKYNQVQFSIVHSHMISEGLFVNMSEEEGCIRSGNLLEYSMLKGIELQAWSPLMASWDDGSFINNPKYENLNNKLQEIANKYNVSKNTIAIAWVLRHPSNITPIVGTTSINHLLELVKAKEIILTREEWYSLYLSAGHILP
jgi:predicted oxidoreductase